MSYTIHWFPPQPPSRSISAWGWRKGSAWALCLIPRATSCSALLLPSPSASSLPLPHQTLYASVSLVLTNLEIIFQLNLACVCIFWLNLNWYTDSRFLGVVNSVLLVLLLGKGPSNLIAKPPWGPLLMDWNINRAEWAISQTFGRARLCFKDR